jgi:hypothetical protein
LVGATIIGTAVRAYADAVAYLVNVAVGPGYPDGAIG